MLVPTLLATLDGRADTISLRPVADTTLFETAPNNNLGHEPTLVVGTTNKGLRDRALVRFDVAGKVPAGVVVISAQLTINVVKESDITAKNSSFELRRFLVSWVEGTKTGLTGAPARGECTWRARSAPDTFWAQPGAAETNEYSAASTPILPISTTGTFTFHSTPALVADVQAWLDHPETNFGWLIRNDSESVAGTSAALARAKTPRTVRCCRSSTQRRLQICTSHDSRCSGSRDYLLDRRQSALPTSTENGLEPNQLDRLRFSSPHQLHQLYHRPTPILLPRRSGFASGGAISRRFHARPGLL